MVPRPPAQPGPVVALRVILAIQVAVLLVGTVLGVGVALSSAADLDDGRSSFAGLGVVLGVVLAVTSGIGALLLGIPAWSLRARRPGPHHLALTAVCVLEGLIAVAAATTTVVVVRSGDVAEGVLPLVVAGVALAAVVLALRPVSWAWARGDRDPAVGEVE